MNAPTLRPSAPFRLHRVAASGHCHRVELLLSLLDLPCTVVDLSLPDVSFYDYTAQAPLGGVSLSDYPRLRGWLARIEALPRFTPLPQAF